MRNWKNWLLPVLTVLAVACLALLPLRLSVWQDEALMGTIHAEELGDSSFPARPPELPERIRLLAWWGDLPETITFVGQALMDDQAVEQGKERIQTELERLTEAGILPETRLEDFGSVSMDRIYLRDQQNLSSAAFLRLDAYDKITGESLSVIVDEESGRILAVEQFSGTLWKEDWDLEELGTAFLDDLELDYEAVTEGFSAAAFRLLDSPVSYIFLRLRANLSIIPQVDWDAVDVEAVYDESVYDVAVSRG